MQASGTRAVHIAQSGAPDGDPNTDTLAAWNNIGRTPNPADPDISAQGPTDGLGLPLYSSTTLNHSIDIGDLSHYDTVKALEGNLVDVAVERPDGNFYFYKGVEMQIMPIPAIAADALITHRLYLSGGDHDPDNLVTETYP